jgi:hypothetical protein
MTVFAAAGWGRRLAIGESQPARNQDARVQQSQHGAAGNNFEEERGNVPTKPLSASQNLSKSACLVIY